MYSCTNTYQLLLIEHMYGKVLAIVLSHRVHPQYGRKRELFGRRSSETRRVEDERVAGAGARTAVQSSTNHPLTGLRPYLTNTTQS